MNRRSILRLLGFAALAPALPAVPVEAAPVGIKKNLLADILQEPLVADVFTCDGSKHTMPLSLSSSRDGVRVTCEATFTGTVSRITIRRGATDLVYLSHHDMGNPHIVRGCSLSTEIRMVR